MDERQDGTIIVAEVGTGHHGEKERAEELIEAAREAGADWVKTQVVWAEEILHPRCGVVPLPGGPVSLYERFRSLEVPEEFYEWFAARALEAGMRPLFSVFGMRSAALMGRLLAVFGGEIPAVKIASPELVYVQLLDAVRRLGMPVVLSSGVSLLGDIETSIGVLRGEGWMVPGWGRVEGDGKGVPVTLLHCVTAYPAPEEDYNLRVLPLLAGLFGVPVGVSDHSRDPELIPATAVALGARMIEKHLCLSHEGGGSMIRWRSSPMSSHGWLGRCGRWRERGRRGSGWCARRTGRAWRGCWGAERSGSRRRSEATTAGRTGRSTCAAP